MAYLQRIVNGGGYIDREYAVGSGRIDLCIRWPLSPWGDQEGKTLAHGTVQRFALELKVWRGGRANPEKAGLGQLARYLSRLGLDEGTLVIFDQRPNAPPFAERGCRETKTVEGRTILVLRL